MKKINLIFTLILGLAILLGSCKKESKDPKMDINQSVLPTITAPTIGTDKILLEADSANPIKFEWTAAAYSVSDGALLPAPTYSLLMVLKDTLDYEKELHNTKGLTFETIVYELNTALIGLGVPADSTRNIELKVESVIPGASYTLGVSEVITVTFTTFGTDEPPPPPEEAKLWVPGDYQGWAPADAPNVWSLEDSGIYTGFIYYPEGGTYEFKFTNAPDWNHSNFGAGEGEGILATDDEAGNLIIPEFGGYVLTCDTIALTWSYLAQNWGVIGSGVLNGDWTEDVDLDYDMANNILTITIDVIEPPDASELRFKFRANDAWDINLGQVEDGSNELSYGGADIMMPEGPGNYTFVLDMSQPTPTYEFHKN
jgi:hypothetical protein